MTKHRRFEVFLEGIIGGSILMYERNCCANGNLTLGEGKRRKTLDVVFLNLLRQIFALFLFSRGIIQMKPVFSAAEHGNCLKDRISLFGCHRIEFTNALFTVHIVDRSQIWIELVNQCMEFQVRKAFLNLVCSVNAEGKRNTLTVIQLFQPRFHVVGVADLDILWEGGICKNINYASFVHRNSYCIKNVEYCL